MTWAEPPQKCMTTRMPGRAATVVGTYSHIWSPPGLFPKLVTCWSDDVSAEAGEAFTAMPTPASSPVATRVSRTALVLERIKFFSLLPQDDGCWCTAPPGRTSEVPEIARKLSPILARADRTVKLRPWRPGVK